jgi:hypothetical protein
MKKKFIIGLAAAALAIVPATAAFGSSHTNAEVVIVHGVPDLEVDILINGETSDLTGLNYQDTATIEVPEGSYTLGVAAAGTTDAIIEADATVSAGESYSVVAYPEGDGSGDGTPTLGVFANENDVAGIQPFHTANFPNVSIIAGGEIVEGFEDIPSGATARIAIDGTVPGVGIGLANSADVAIDLGDVEVPADTLVLAYAVGPAGDAPDVIVETVSTHSGDTPSSVPSGSAGLVSNTLPAAVLALMLLGAVAIATPALAAARRRC